MKLPQLSLRDLFWLVLVVALGCGWLVDHSIMASWVERISTHSLRQREGDEQIIQSLLAERNRE